MVRKTPLAPKPCVYRPVYKPVCTSFSHLDFSERYFPLFSKITEKEMETETSLQIVYLNKEENEDRGKIKHSL